MQTVQHEIHLTDYVPVEPRSGVRGVIQESACARASLQRWSRHQMVLCGGDRKLNAKNRRDAFPLPQIDKSFDPLRGVIWVVSRTISKAHAND